jgi:hypothetical protein
MHIIPFLRESDGLTYNEIIKSFKWLYIKRIYRYFWSVFVENHYCFIPIQIIQLCHKFQFVHSFGDFMTIFDFAFARIDAVAHMSLIYSCWASYLGLHSVVLDEGRLVLARKGCLSFNVKLLVLQWIYDVQMFDTGRLIPPKTW